MSSQALNVSSLMPDLKLLIQGDFNSSAGFSAAIVALLAGIFITFLILTIINYYRSRQKIKFYDSLVGDIKTDDLLDKRREITKKALSNENYGNLWREFDESLVDLPKKNRVCNTLDAAHFFNTHTLAKGLTENRLIAAVPGFLTAIGVIGTFAGLQMGLVELDGLNPKTATSEQLTQGIFGMIGGASIAFMTSVWGVFFSVAFNFIEKSFERSIRNAISNFQNQIDFLYPRITAEQSLSQIEEFSRQSNDKLGELDEKIGHRLQEAMRETSVAIQEGIRDSLNNVLGPAIEQLVNNAHSGSEKALDSMLNRFLDGMGNAGERQRELMEGATSQLGNAANNMTDGMNGFLEKLDSHVEGISEKNDTALQDMHQLFTEQMDLQQSKTDARQVVINEQVRRMDKSQQSLSENLEQVMTNQEEQFARIKEGVESVIERFQLLMTSHGEATSAMRSISGEILGASNQLGLLSQNTKEANILLKETTVSLAESLREVASENRQVLEGNEKLQGAFIGISSSIEGSSLKLQQAAELAESGLKSVDNHFNSLGISLRDHVSKLEEQVSSLLENYSSQVRAQTVERLNEWNAQTNEYTSDMTRAVQALSSVVDEIDSKLRSA